MKYLKYVVLGILFGIILVKSEVISWFRIQEMFRFQSFRMYGILGSAILVGMLSIAVIKKFKIRTVGNEPVVIADKTFHWGNVIGGLIFGLGWAMTGACPGPLFAQIGSGYGVVLFTLAFAILGTWVYGLIKEKLPH
ncbi:MAG: YeeE/YedE thiosulfate transporter family protein [Bacteroidota bacterium]|nr:YeeE/YedE thiosulfate transporter family protein [Bacteroidota bacterium]MDP4216710.1 YeeE/YedE thiosulfate transporter family protein [Bacteroidota bacterium]MDP4245964.1 YeeE/YedE thiosulfate transporter family protein [Bacteroidota bacterium]MDP4253591.1 YeeE/YedE thiosulfate transporter family protein [Bacteroidota bacterium]MDP4257254.1 YeeE/YedE thiosulfate transporter family protein [Bacteroidota bacterium]